MKTTLESRRALLRTGLTMIGGLVASQAVVAPVCQQTPEQTEGPFYPVKDQADKDADLTQVQGARAAALGTVIEVQGTVRDENCEPVAGVLVEIWQACASGKYNHPGDPNKAPLDPNFQYWGKALTEADGSYKFKTVIPGSYQANATWRRPPHIHFKISKLGYREIITQLYFKGDALNDKDLILKDLSPEEQERVVVPLIQKLLPTATFDIGIVSIS